MQVVRLLAILDASSATDDVSVAVGTELHCAVGQP